MQWDLGFSKAPLTTVYKVKGDGPCHERMEIMMARTVRADRRGDECKRDLGVGTDRTGVWEVREAGGVPGFWIM